MLEGGEGFCGLRVECGGERRLPVGIGVYRGDRVAKFMAKFATGLVQTVVFLFEGIVDLHYPSQNHQDIIEHTLIHHSAFNIQISNKENGKNSSLNIKLIYNQTTTTMF